MLHVRRVQDLRRLTLNLSSPTSEGLRSRVLGGFRIYEFQPYTVNLSSSTLNLHPPCATFPRAHATAPHAHLYNTHSVVILTVSVCSIIPSLQKGLFFTALTCGCHQI